MSSVNHARTLWEEGREPGRQVVALGIALALTAVVLDVALAGRIGLVFDLSFVVMSLALALVVRPTDFFVVGVLPPLIMLGVFVLLGLTSPAVIATPQDGVVQAVITGLASHSGALVAGYVLCLACLAIRQHVLRTRGSDVARSPRRPAATPDPEPQRAWM